jgi:asparagine synthase (glutamine-hydrolysing)
MCGIAGVLSLGNGYRVCGDEVRAMADRITHRGPDTSGIWVDYIGRIGLGHRRLSILDLSEAGNQPMLSADGRHVVAFNGEIYNHKDLRKELNGHLWRGSSDTETLLACIQHWGIHETLSRIAGMYAFALWDRHEERLYLARDRFGEKPIYYSKVGQGDSQVLIFASELKALKAYPGFRAEVDRSSVGLFFEFSYIPAPHSIYCETFKLEAGTVIEFDLQMTEGHKCRYWKSEEVYLKHLSGMAAGVVGGRGFVDGLDEVLRLVIREQMLADVPLGAFLSGGIDSTTIVAMMQAQSASKVKTFTIGYNERAYSEAEHAKSVAAYLGTEHTELYVNDSMAESVIPKLPFIYDEPFADPSQIPTVLVCQLAGNSVKVALSGDGGDEMFGGYNRYWMTSRYWNKLKSVPAPLLRMAGQAMTMLPEHIWDRVAGFLPLTSVGFKIHKAARVIGSRDCDDLYLKLIANWPHDHGLVKGSHPRSTLVKELVGGFEIDPVHQMMILDILTYLPDDILAKVDRAAMNSSLETRAPFLDHRVASYAWSIPLEYKLRDKKTKWVLRELLYRYVPKDLVDRPKMGFGFPIDVWLRSGLRDWAEDLLCPRRMAEDGILNPEPISKKWQQHLSGQYNWAIQLWAVLMFQAWLRQERER